MQDTRGKQVQCFCPVHCGGANGPGQWLAQSTKRHHDQYIREHPTQVFQQFLSQNAAPSLITGSAGLSAYNHPDIGALHPPRKRRREDDEEPVEGQQVNSTGNIPVQHKYFNCAMAGSCISSSQPIYQGPRPIQISRVASSMSLFSFHLNPIPS